MKTCISMLVVAISVLLAEGVALAACPACPGEDPNFAFEDVDNDGCYDDMIDVGPIDEMLLGGVYVAPGSSGLVIPKTAKIQGEGGVALDWSAENVRISGKPSSRGGADLTIAAATTLDLCERGKIVADASLSVVAAGAIELGGKNKLQARVGTLSVESSGATMVIGRKVKIKAAGDATVMANAALTVAEGLKVKTRSPGAVAVQSSAGGVAFGEKLSIKSGGIAIGGDAAVALGINAKLETKKDAGESISIVSVSDRVDVGEAAKITADADLTIAAGTDLELAEACLLTATTGTLSLSTVSGALLAAPKQSLSAGADLTLAGQTSIVFEPKQSWQADGTVALTSQGLIDVPRLKVLTLFQDVVVSSAGDDVKLIQCSVKSKSLETAMISGNICDLTECKFTMPLDTSGCTSVIGP